LSGSIIAPDQTVGFCLVGCIKRCSLQPTEIGSERCSLQTTEIREF